MNRFIKSIGTLLFCSVILISGCGGYDEHVKQVRNSTILLDEVIPSSFAPNVAKIGDAFDQLLKDGKWESFESAAHQRVVQYTGIAINQNTKEKYKIKIQFLKKGTCYIINCLEINGQAQNQLAAMGFVNDIVAHYVPPAAGKK